ncbi:unnamed protein product [Meganyctiphanes norvegica]|uniref:XK-related protein n=1 Tax=Meganyctiphanes norvegica TaxID=48144 RepID=A0AAV2RTV3_MEGNR
MKCCPKPFNNTINWCRKSGTNTKTWCLDTGTNSKTWCLETGTNSKFWCLETHTKAKTWCGKRYYKLKPAWKIVGFLFYVLDVTTDIYTAVQHYYNGNYGWSGLTAVFTVVPLVMVSATFIILIHRSNLSILRKFLLTLAVILCSPILPYVLLIGDIITTFWVLEPGSHRSYVASVMKDVIVSIFGHDTGNHAAVAVSGLKIIEALVESYPQAGLQMFIISQSILYGTEIGTWQLLTIASSIMTLSFTITSNISTRGLSHKVAYLIFFVFGMVTVASRLMVCSFYSMVCCVSITFIDTTTNNSTLPTHSSLWFIPFVTMFFGSVFVWSIIRCCPNFLCAPLVDTHRIDNIFAFIYVGCTWLLTATYNGFTLSGLVVSTINLLFAMGGCFLNVPPHIAITSLILAATSWAGNVILTTIPSFKDIGN